MKNGFNVKLVSLTGAQYLATNHSPDIIKKCKNALAQ
jgi:hypothetical protein